MTNESLVEKYILSFSTRLLVSSSAISGSIYPCCYRSSSILINFFSLSFFHVISPPTLIIVAIKSSELSLAMSFVLDPVSIIVSTIHPGAPTSPSSSVIWIIAPLIHPGVVNYWHQLVNRHHHEHAGIHHHYIWIHHHHVGVHLHSHVGVHRSCLGHRITTKMVVR